MSEADRLRAFRNTLRACVLAGVIASISGVLDTHRYGFWPLGFADLLHALQAAVLGLWMWRSGSRWSARASDRALVALVLPYLITIWIPPVLDLHRGTLVEPLLAHHFLLLGLAVLSPSKLLISTVLIVMFAVHGVALWMVLDRSAPSPVLKREPWFTLAFAAIALGLLASRSRRRALAESLIQAEARADAVARLNRVLFALRDRANTPLQTLEVGLSVLERRSMAGSPAIEAMRRALEDLVEVQHTLARIPAAELPLQLDLDRELGELQRAADRRDSGDDSVPGSAHDQDARPLEPAGA